MMPALTTAEIFHIRAMSGDDCAPYDVSDEYMQWLHDEKASRAPRCMSGDSLGSTIVWVLRARVRKAIKLFDEDGEGGTRSVSQKYTHLKEQLALAEAACGMSGGVIGTGVIDQQLDTDGGSEYSPFEWGNGP